jgi:hypothetical protein
MPPRALTVKDHADWLTPSRAVQILNAAYSDPYLSKLTILEHLRAGMVQAIAEHSALESTRPQHARFVLISSQDWKKVDATDSLWKTGHLTYTFIDENSAFRSNGTARHFNVRFEPQGVHAIIKNMEAPAKSDASSQETDSAPGADSEADYRKLPPAAKAHLEAWYDLYSQVYGGSPQDTLPNAVRSARGMFPGRFVSRDKVRDLAGGRSPGRKARKDP